MHSGRTPLQHKLAVELWNQDVPVGTAVAWGAQCEIQATAGPAWLTGDGIAVVKIRGAGVQPLEFIKPVLINPTPDHSIEGDMDARKPGP